MLSCTLDNISAQWQAVSSVNELGEIVTTQAPLAHGYTCNNCGLGFGDWAGCLGHIVGRFVPKSDVAEASVEAKGVAAEQIPDPVPDTTPPAVSLV